MLNRKKERSKTECMRANEMKAGGKVMMQVLEKVKLDVQIPVINHTNTMQVDQNNSSGREVWKQSYKDKADVIWT